MMDSKTRTMTDSAVVLEVFRFTGHHYRSILVSLPLAFIALKIWRAWFDPLRSIPGPFLARFTRLWLFFGFYSRRWKDINWEIHQKYGPIVRVAPGQYSVNDADAVRSIYAHGTKFPKSDWYIPFNTKHEEGLFGGRDIGNHAMLRRKLQGAYAMSALTAYEPYIRDCVELFQHQLDRLENQDIDLMHWAHGFAFDVIGMITFSHRFGFLESGRDDIGFMTSIPRNSRNNMLIGVYPIVFPWIHDILALFYGKGIGIILFEYVQAQMSRVKQLIQEEKATKGAVSLGVEDEPLDFISKLLRLEQDPESKKGITDFEVRLAALTNLAAGSDSTGIGITATIYYLYRHPKVLTRLREEVQEAKNTAGLGDQSILPFSMSKRLPYLQAVIKEAIRMHPASGVPLPRAVPSEGALICGRKFPAGTVVMANAWVTHQNQDIWGEDAARFNPNRWLEPGGVPPEVQNLSWGQGARVCIGRNIAEQQLNVLVPTLVMRYDFELAPELGDKIPTDSAVFARPHNVFATIRRRKTRDEQE